MDKISNWMNENLLVDPTNDFPEPPLGEPIHIHTLTYKRIKNLGNYESEALEATALVTLGDDPKECFLALKDYVEEQLKLNSVCF